MIGFHIDMNMAQYRADYLSKWLKELAASGFDTIIWEVENNIQWASCPECVSPDAFSIDEFRKLLDECRSLGMNAVPLFQTISHGEYVLKHKRYEHMKELPDRLDQYCPRNPDVMPFLQTWLEEYLEVFGDVTHFHIGADEAWFLGACPECSEFAREHSLSKLYIDHINAIAQPLIDRDITPIIWADMAMHHHEALEQLSRKIMLFDWMYDIYRGNGKVFIWGEDLKSKDQLTEANLQMFGKYMFPKGDELAREPETFYSADFLADNGFKVVTCPGSASAGDNVFSPRNWLHIANTFDSFQKGASEHLSGSVLTSWSVRIHPWEQQLACIDIPGFLRKNPKATKEEFVNAFAAERFGLQNADELMLACGLLSQTCIFTDSISLNIDKHCLLVADDYIGQKITQLREERKIEAEAANCRKRLADYRKSLEMFESIATQATCGSEYLEIWKLQARNLINRAEASEMLLTQPGEPIKNSVVRAKAKRILDEMRSLRKATDDLFSTMIRPTRKDEMVEYMFGCIERALAGRAGE